MFVKIGSENALNIDLGELIIKETARGTFADAIFRKMRKIIFLWKFYCRKVEKAPLTKQRYFQKKIKGVVIINRSGKHGIGALIMEFMQMSIGALIMEYMPCEMLLLQHQD